MGESRTKNAVRNMTYGFLNKILVLILPFVTRTIIIYLLGASYLGIGTLFSSILNFLSLSELGLSSAIVYSMYRPIAEGNSKEICSLLNYYRGLYRKIGFTILFLGTAILPGVPYLTKGEVPADINVYILYYIYLVNSVISYFFAGYKQSLLTAHQRTDITNNISTFVTLFVQMLQILALYYTRNFYAYAFVPICGTIITNVCNTVITNKKYKEYKCKGEISDESKKSIKKKLSGLFGTKLNSIVVHSADTIVISAFLGLSMTGKYGNYYYIMNAVCGFVAIIFSSMIAGIGNKLVTDSIESNYKLFKNLSFFNAWFVGWASVCFVCIFEPFMNVWVGKDFQFGLLFVILFTLYFYIYEIQRTILAFKDAAGYWNKDRYRPYVSMVFNLVSNLILVQYIGIYGIVVSTILAFMISLPWANYVLFKYLFKIPSWKNLLNILKYFLITCGVTVITYIFCHYTCGDGIIGLIFRIAICVILPNIIFYIIFRKKEEWLYFKSMIRKYIKI